MFFSYRARQRWKYLLHVLLYILLALVAFACCLLLWLQRFILYTPDGVHLDFSLVQPTDAPISPVTPTHSQVNIEYISPEEPEETPDTPIQESQRLAGYYIEASVLQQKDFTLVYEQLATLPAGTPVMLDVCSIRGNFYYSSAHGNASTAYDIEQMNALIQYLAESDFYLIAKLPALRNYQLALKNPMLGIQHVNGYVWLDSAGGYWLDPTKDSVLSYLIQVIKELRGLGFDEVVLQDFTIPEAETIVYNKDRQEVLNSTAQALVTACTNDRFTLSFVAGNIPFQLPEGHSRLYLMHVAAADVEQLLNQLAIEHPETELVIIAESFDTRYDVCGTLHPLSQAH